MLLKKGRNTLVHSYVKKEETVMGKKKCHLSVEVLKLLKAKLFLLHCFFLSWCDVRNMSTNTYHQYFHGHRKLSQSFESLQ